MSFRSGSILRRFLASWSSVSKIPEFRRESWRPRNVGLATAGLVIGGGIIISDYVEENNDVVSSFQSSTIESLAQTLVSLRRFLRSSSVAFTIALDYKYLYARFDDYASAEYRAARSLVHSRAATRLVRLCNEQGSIYVKFGQSLSSMTHAIPPEYTTPMKSLQDKVTPSSFESMLPVLKEEIGPLATKFQFIDPVPIATASLAQVHKGILRDEAQSCVAIKIQHPNLRQKVESDLKTVQTLSKVLRRVFGGFDTEWLLKAFRENLYQEMDFSQEAESGLRVAHNFADDTGVVIPAVYPNLSTEKVLTMDFIDGARIDDLNYLSSYGIDCNDLASRLAEAFAQMVFKDGFCHCDGHAGNLMVRANANAPGGFELIIIDHGLYRELDDSFRRAYCLLWRGLISRSDTDVRQACTELGTPGLEDLFSLALLRRSWSHVRDKKTDIRKNISREEMQKLRRQFKDGEMNMDEETVQNLSHDLLLIFKMNSLIGNIIKSLGAEVDRFRVNCRFAVQGLHHRTDNRRLNTDDPIVDNKEGAWTLLATPSEWADRVALEVRLLMLDAILGLYQFWNWFRGASGKASSS